MLPISPVLTAVMPFEEIKARSEGLRALTVTLAFMAFRRSASCFPTLPQPVIRISDDDMVLRVAFIASITAPSAVGTLPRTAKASEWV